jgi:DNA-directed RNA polymerase subunit RPC12/RpoP
MFNDRGQNFPSFGNYRCPRCGRTWHSNRALVNVSQRCSSCGANVQPFNLQNLYVYTCRECDRRWESGYVPNGIRCSHCESSILILPLNRDNPDDRALIREHDRRQPASQDQRMISRPSPPFESSQRTDSSMVIGNGQREIDSNHGRRSDSHSSLNQLAQPYIRDRETQNSLLICCLLIVCVIIWFLPRQTRT